jgi:hypothetical protein
MTPKDLEDEAWSIIETARMSVDSARRQLLIDEAYELLKKARLLRDLDPAFVKQARQEAEDYRLWLTHIEGATLWIDLKVKSRPDAFWAAEALAAACAEQFDGYELWHGSRFLLGGETGHCRFSLKTGFEVSLASQLTVLETEAILKECHRVLARSRKLLAATEALRRQLATTPVN